MRRGNWAVVLGKSCGVFAFLACLTIAAQGGEIKLRAPKSPERDAVQPQETTLSEECVAEESSEGKAASATKPETGRKTRKASLEQGIERLPIVEQAALMTVETLIPTKFFDNVEVLRAFCRVPREDFLPRKRRESAYSNVEVQLDCGLIAPTPFNCAYAIQALDPQSTDRVLVVETGSGYQAATLGLLVSEVFSVSADRTATKNAAAALKKLKLDNISCQQVSDVCDGWAEEGPYDKILVTRAVSEIPKALTDSLKDGGRIVAPVGDYYRQIWTFVDKKDNMLTANALIPTRLEPLVKGTLEKDVRDLSLVGGDFETLDPVPVKTRAIQGENALTLPALNPTPEGWYDAWNVEIVKPDVLYEGSRACRLSNEAVALEHEKKDRNEERTRAATLPENRRESTKKDEAIRRGRETELRASLKQSLGIDAAKVKKFEISGAFRASNLCSRSSNSSAEVARIEYFDKDRKSLGEGAILEIPLSDTSWQEFEVELSPPARAREAVLTIGLFDSVGTLEFDALSITY
ncbi:MAG: protein-L-isoaspartate O-methyltransferase [Thermoguttaceae bacterium]